METTIKTPDQLLKNLPVMASPSTRQKPSVCKGCGDFAESNPCYQCAAKVRDSLLTIPPFYRGKPPLLPSVDGWPARPFLTLLGRAGIGKTITAAALVTALARETVKPIKFVNCAELMLRIRGTFRESARETEEDVIKDIARAPILLLDDLASEKVSDFSTATLYLILNRRGEHGKPTVVTSNLTMPEIVATLGDRIANRLARFGEVLTLEKAANAK